MFAGLRSLRRPKSAFLKNIQRDAGVKVLTAVHSVYVWCAWCGRSYTYWSIGVLLMPIQFVFYKYSGAIRASKFASTDDTLPISSPTDEQNAANSQSSIQISEKGKLTEGWSCWGVSVYRTVLPGLAHSIALCYLFVSFARCCWVSVFPATIVPAIFCHISSSLLVSFCHGARLVLAKQGNEYRANK